MTTQDDGGPVFPVTHEQELYGTSGMSLRDWFAGQALAGLLAGGFADTVPHDSPDGGSTAAAFAYQYAHAMLKERQP